MHSNEEGMSKSWCKSKRKTKKVQKKFILDQSEQTLNAKNQLFLFSQKTQQQQFQCKGYQFTSLQKNINTERGKKVSSWYDQNMHQKRTSKQINNKKQIWRGVNYQKMHFSRTQNRSASDIGANKTISRIYEVFNRQNLNQSNQIKTIYNKKQIQSNIVRLHPYPQKKVLTDPYTTQRLPKKESTFLRSNISQKKRTLDAKKQLSYDKFRQANSINLSNQTNRSCNFKTLAGNYIKNKKKGKWIYPKNVNLKVSRVYQLEDSPLQKQFSNIVKLLQKQKVFS